MPLTVSTIGPLLRYGLMQVSQTNMRQVQPGAQHATQARLVGQAQELLVDLSEQGQGPLNERLKRALRAAVRSGRLPVGTVLPPSRRLAEDLGVSRWTVTEAYAQLVAEGYLESRTGSATRVRWSGTGHLGPPSVRLPSAGMVRYDLSPGLPDLRAFPRRAWAKALSGEAQVVPSGELAYPDPAGHPRCRLVLGGYLQRSRGVSLDGAEVQIRTSATAGVRQLCRVLAAAGIREVAVEDPGWTRLHEVIRGAGLQVVAIPVDEHGLRVDVLSARQTPVRAVVVTPAHQFPQGVVLSPARRGELLAWADRVDGVVVEDDYDAEFRYDRAPVATLQGMRPDRVVLVGSVSKTLSPALRLGWLVGPARWRGGKLERGGVAGAGGAAGSGDHDGAMLADGAEVAVPPTLDQLALAALIESGAYDRHLRAARRRYRARRDTLVQALGARLPGTTVSGVAAGLHLLLHLPGSPPDGAVGPSFASGVAQAAARQDIALVALNRYCIEATGEALVIGYGNLADRDVDHSVRLLSAIIEARHDMMPTDRGADLDEVLTPERAERDGQPGGSVGTARARPCLPLRPP
ncbi:PLP-dependent aminotransferase family protein [Jannaschia sp. R86511]|uniref:aminotransferase-like domain-containing protein n=1 Tax=Jannaschia sp. R86511 TaxID=3093853 RepID=UPI0036D3FCCF